MPNPAHGEAAVLEKRRTAIETSTPSEADIDAGMIDTRQYGVHHPRPRSA